MSEFLSAVISFIIVLGPLILIHEFGHFIACRMVGVTVLEFGLGFPPRAIKLFEQRGTEFTLNWLPLGGFVRPLGEDFVRPLGPEATEKERQQYAQYQAELEALGKKVPKLKAVQDATPLQRLFFLIAGSGMNFLAAFVILVLVATMGMPPIIAAAAPGSPADQAGLRYRDAIIEVNGQPVRSTEDIDNAIQGANGGALNLVVDRRGERIPVTLMPSEARIRNQSVRISGVLNGYPAEGKFQPGDIIVRLDNRVVSTTAAVQQYIRERPDTPVTFVVYRDGKEESVEVTPQTTGSGEVMVGINLQQLEFDTAGYGLDAWDRQIGAPFGEAVTLGLRQMGAILEQLVLFPVQLIRGELSPEEARPVSVVGISQLGGQVLEETIEDRALNRLLNFAALISIALGFTNLLPIPGLDGGRILFVLVEILRGKPMAPEREGAIHFVGLMIILGLFVILVINDIVNPITNMLR